jgi:hypothetical protein
MTAVGRLAVYVRDRYETSQNFENFISNLIQQEKKQIIDAMMYALDEDGHTGDWKIKFVETYYNKMYNESNNL